MVFDIKQKIGVVGIDKQTPQEINGGGMGRNNVKVVNTPKEKEKCKDEAERKLRLYGDNEVGNAIANAAEEKCIENAKLIAAVTFKNGVYSLVDKYSAIKSIPDRNVNAKEYTDDILEIESPKLLNGSFQPESINGVFEHRPEIISVVNFNPIYSGDFKHNNLSTHGKLIEMQHQISLVRKQTLIELFNSMQKNHSRESIQDAQKIFNDIRDKYNDELKNLQNLNGFYSQALKDIENLYSFFDLKSKSDKQKNQEEKDQYFGLIDFYKQYMGYTEKNFNGFTGTRIYLQLASDFRQVLENYSFNLLDISDSDRLGDSPTKIDTTITVNDGFSFTVEKLRSDNVIQNAADKKYFSDFLKSLPENSSDRIKILSTLISKEYRISNALGNSEVKNNLSQNFNSGDQGNPFDNIVGIPNNSIFNLPLGTESLSSLAYERIPVGTGVSQQDLVVFPFEQKYIDDVDSKITYIPGTSYYVDSIFELKETRVGNESKLEFNTDPLIKFVNQFETKVNKSSQAILSLLGYSDNGQKSLIPELQSESIYTRLLSSIVVESTSNISVGDQKHFSNSETIQSFTCALFKLANKDEELKFLLFQYCLLVGLLSNFNKNPNSVWSELAVEFKTINAFGSISEIKKDNKNKRAKQLKDQETDLLKGPYMIVPYIKVISEDIDRRVREIVLKNVDQYEGNLNDNPNIRRQAVARAGLAKENQNNSKLSPRSFLGNPFVATINENYIYSVLMQIASEVNHERDSNIFREYVDFINRITNVANSNGNRNYLLPDGSGRTRYNFVSTSTQMLVFFELFSSVVDKFIFIDISKTAGNIITEANETFIKLVRQESKKMIQNRFVGESITIGGFSKKIENIFGADNVDDYVIQKVGAEQINDQIIDELRKKGEKKREEKNLNGEGVILIDNNEKKSIVTSLNGLAEKIKKEKFIALNFLYLFKQMSSKLSLAKMKALSTFNENNLQRYLSNVGGNPAAIKSSIKSNSHIKTSAYLIENEIKRANQAQEEANQFSISSTNGQNSVDQVEFLKTPIVSKTVPSEVKESLYSLMRNSAFSELSDSGTTTKIITVGVPSGFVKATNDRARTSETSIRSFKRNENTIVYVKIFKRDLRRDDLVFKPQKFIFDLDLHVREFEIKNHVKPTPDMTFDRILNDCVLIDTSDAQKMKKISSRTVNKKGSGSQYSLNIDKVPKYNFLSATPWLLDEMHENHVKSFLLGEYIKLSSGISFSEENFLSKKLADYKVDPKFESLILSYLKENLGENILENITLQQALNSPSVSNNAKETIREVLWGNDIVSPSRTKEKIIGLKKFDRVLNMSFNIDDFEIDVETTTKSQGGKNMFRNLKTSKSFRTVVEGNETRTYLKKRTKSDIVFEDYFITIETLND